MKLTTPDLRQLADLAVLAAAEAGQMIAQSRPLHIEHKAGGHSLASQVVTEIDRRSEDIILDVLHPTLERYDLGLLTEEQPDEGGRLSADYFWCIDPLDGTLPFIEGLPGYAVSIALVGHDGTPCIGVICDPLDGTMFHAIAGEGSFRNRNGWPTEPNPIEPNHSAQVLSVFTDRSFFRADDHDAVVLSLEQIARDMGLAGVDVQEPRGAVMNACGALANPLACYFKFPKPTTGGGSLWDFAATACLFHEAGAIATDLNGDPLDLNRAGSTFMNHRGVLYATNEALAERIQAI